MNFWLRNTDKSGGHRYAIDVLLRSLIFDREMKGMRVPPDPLSEKYYKSSGYLPVPVEMNGGN